MTKTLRIGLAKLWDSISRLTAKSKRLKSLKWFLAAAFTFLGPLSIYYFKSPGNYPATLPVLNAHHNFNEPIPLNLIVEKNFAVTVSLDLTQCKDSLMSPITLLLPNGADEVALDYSGQLLDISNVPPVYFKKYETSQIHIMLTKEDFKRLNRKKVAPTESDWISLRFKLKDHFINHSYSSKSFILFYLSMAGNQKGKGQNVRIGLQTPINLLLNNSIPSPERILPFNDHLVYDFENSAEDSGLLFNFTDNSRSIFEEISLFIISSFFGFFTGVIIENLLLSKKKK